MSTGRLRGKRCGLQALLTALTCRHQSQQTRHEPAPLRRLGSVFVLLLLLFLLIIISHFKLFYFILLTLTLTLSFTQEAQKKDENLLKFPEKLIHVQSAAR